MSLFWRVVAINAGGLVVAALVLALSPATISPDLAVTEAVVLFAGTLALIAINTVLLRRVFGPLDRLTSLMRRVDPMEPGLRIELDRPAAEVAELCDSFNAMLDRLEHERRASGRRALLAQEGERRRLARELHDEVGQTLTGVVLQLEGLGRMAPTAARRAGRAAAGDRARRRRGGARDRRAGCGRRRSTSSGCAAR